MGYALKLHVGIMVVEGFRVCHKLASSFEADTEK
jgi:hypothetical protein